MSGPGAAGGSGATASIVVVSKDEPALAETLDRLAEQVASVPRAVLSEVEILVVDASSGRLSDIRDARPGTSWIDFEQPPRVRTSIAHQRNVGVRASRGEIVVFTDSGCIPRPGWLEAITSPIVAGLEEMTCGQTGATGESVPYSIERADSRAPDYVAECPTINVAFRRDVYERVGGFDESFTYGSDIDFSWRVVHHGIRIRFVPAARVDHDWGALPRQIRRSFAYGRGRGHLYRKHVLGRGEQSVRKRSVNLHDAVPVLYPAFLLGLPLVRRHRAYLLLLLLPIWRNRRSRPLWTLVEHLVLAVGVLVGLLTTDGPTDRPVSLLGALGPARR
ncbi:MAG: glycosyltransferase [Actinomycetota bacterium]|nr:glycosyltransferase [Actinomycetota bacterium]